MSAVVDVWGWRARLRLARGQTIADVTAKIPAIESGLGTFRGAVRVYPTPDDLANRCELRVLDMDPHADAIPWPGPSVASITEPIDLGPFEDATPCRVLFLRRHGLAGGTTGSGKSGWLNVLMGNLVACPDVVIWAIDLKKGMELKPWQSCIGRLATTPEQATALLRDAVAILQARAELLAATGQRVWEPSPDMPALVIIIDEYAELADDAPDAIKHADSIARLGRAVAVTMIAATQRPTQKAMGQGAVRSQMDIRICFRVRERQDVDLILGQGMLNAGWHAHTPQRPRQVPRLRTRARHSQARPRLPRHRPGRQRNRSAYADSRRRLDEVSRRAIDASKRCQRRIDGRHEPSDAEPAGAEPAAGMATAEDALWFALCMAPEEGTEIGELTRAHRHEPSDPVPPPSRARQGRPRGAGQPWTLAREHHRGAVTMSDRLTACLISRLARASARKRAYMALRQTLRQARSVAARGGAGHRGQGHQPADSGRDLVESHRRPQCAAPGQRARSSCNGSSERLTLTANCRPTNADAAPSTRNAPTCFASPLTFVVMPRCLPRPGG